MKKYFVKDEDGSEHLVTELDEEMPTEEVEVTEKQTLTDDEVTALKMLAPFADKLLALINDEQPAEELETEDACDEDEEVAESEEIEEQVVDTKDIDGKKTACDSKKSFGSIETKQQVDDSIVEDEVSEAWAKRYKMYGGR